MSDSNTPKSRNELRFRKMLHISAQMRDMILALVPILVFAVSYFGYRVLILSVISVLTASLTDVLYLKLFRRGKSFVFDFSSAVTGLMIVYLMPPESPWYLPVIGSFVAVFFAKMVFGGYGQNLLNPALLGHLCLLIFFPMLMTRFTLNGIPIEIPLSMWLNGKMEMIPSYASCFLGVIPGNIGETSIILILLSGVFLMIRKLADFRIPLTFFVAFLVVTLIYQKAGFYPILTGDICFVGFLMLTDPVTAPKTKKLKWIYGAVTGILMAVIRMMTPFPFYASSVVLLMNLVFRWIDSQLAKKAEVKEEPSSGKE